MFCLYQPFNTYRFLRGCFGEGTHLQKITFATYKVAQEWCLIFHFIIFLSISCLLFSVITTLCNTNDKAEVIFLSGSYKSSHLITMIALHLDATFAAYDIWEEFATCILILQTQNSFLEDQMPMDYNKRHFPYCGTVHQSFVQDGARRLWKLRIKWWLQRHFSEIAWLAELQNGGYFWYFPVLLFMLV